MSERKATQASKAIGARTTEENSYTAKIIELLGPPPLTDFDCRTAFEQIETQICESFAPLNPIDLIWIREAAEHIVEAARLRRAMTSVIRLERRNAVIWLLARARARELFDPTESVWDMLTYEDRQILAAGPKAIAARLAEIGFAETAIDDQARILKMRDLEVLDRQMTRALSRRDQVLRNMGQCRSAIAAQLRARTDKLMKEVAE